MRHAGAAVLPPKVSQYGLEGVTRFLTRDAGADNGKNRRMSGASTNMPLMRNGPAPPKLWAPTLLRKLNSRNPLPIFLIRGNRRQRERGVPPPKGIIAENEMQNLTAESGISCRGS